LKMGIENSSEVPEVCSRMYEDMTFVLLGTQNIWWIMVLYNIKWLIYQNELRYSQIMR